MFVAVRRLFKDYADRRYNGGAEADEREYLIEGQQRLEHLDFIVTRVMELLRPTERSDLVAYDKLRQMVDATPQLASSGEPLAGLEAHLKKCAPIELNETEIRVLTEAFYYLAFRLRNVVRDRLDGLGGFEAEGVRDVRCQLLEHPEGKQSGVIENGMSYGDAGPVLKGVRNVEKVSIYPDKGLYANAKEFVECLSDKLNQYLAR